MQRVGVRELQRNTSAWLRRVEQGESFEVTIRGRPVAHLVPLPTGNEIEQLIASGRLRPAEGDPLDLGEPLEPAPGEPLPSEILARARADER